MRFTRFVVRFTRLVVVRFTRLVVVHLTRLVVRFTRSVVHLRGKAESRFCLHLTPGLSPMGVQWSLLQSRHRPKTIPIDFLWTPFLVTHPVILIIPKPLFSSQQDTQSG